MAKNLAMVAEKLAAAGLSIDELKKLLEPQQEAS